MRRNPVSDALDAAINTLEVYAQSAQVPQTVFRLVGEVCRAAREVASSAPVDQDTPVTQVEADPSRSKFEETIQELESKGFTVTGITVALK
jgi:hypothetical protein